MTIGQRIKARRKQLGISADTLAERVGVSRSTVFRWEKGEIDKIPAIELNKISKALHTTDEYLFGVVDDPEDNTVGMNANNASSAIENDKIRTLSHVYPDMPPEMQLSVDIFLEGLFRQLDDQFRKGDAKK